MNIKKAVLSPETAEDRLHNALLDAGVADWVEIRRADDGVNLIAELFDTLTSNQVDALKPRYDVVLHPANSFIYSFAERVAVAPLVDPAKVEAQVRQCWAGGHGGKIASIEPTTDPREWIVTTAKPVPANANLRNHGLALVKQIAPEVTHVRVMDELWAKLLQKPTPETTATTEAAVIADTDTQPVPTTEPTAPELDERDLEINQLKTQVENLYEIIRSLTPVTDEWQTVKITLPKDGKVIAHPEIAAEQAKGWDVHHVNYISNGEDRLYVLMVKRGKAKRTTLEETGYASRIAAPRNGNGRYGEITPVAPRYQREIDLMNDELTPSMNALAAAFGVDLGAWR